MFRNVSFFLSSLVAASTFQGCTASGDPASQPGMSHRETHALVETYYWQRHSETPSYSDAEFDALLARSADPTLDGERGENQASAVAVALSVVGDQRFARALSHQPHAVRGAVARDISYLWTHYQLYYPQTQALLQGQPNA